MGRNSPCCAFSFKMPTDGKVRGVHLFCYLYLGTSRMLLQNCSPTCTKFLDGFKWPNCTKFLDELEWVHMLAHVSKILSLQTEDANIFPNYLSSWKTGAKCLQHQWIVLDTNLKILEGDFPILVVVHLLHGHLDQVLDPLVRLLLHPRAEKCSLQQIQHLLPEKFNHNDKLHLKGREIIMVPDLMELQFFVNDKRTNTFHCTC